MSHGHKAPYLPTPAEIAAGCEAIRAEHRATHRDERGRPRQPRVHGVEPGVLQPTRDFVFAPPGPDSCL